MVPCSKESYVVLESSCQYTEIPDNLFINYYFYWGIIDAQHHTNYRCTTQWLIILKGYTPLTVVKKCWVHSLPCIIHPAVYFTHNSLAGWGNMGVQRFKLSCISQYLYFEFKFCKSSPLGQQSMHVHRRAMCSMHVYYSLPLSLFSYSICDIPWVHICIDHNVWVYSRTQVGTRSAC